MRLNAGAFAPFLIVASMCVVALASVSMIGQNSQYLPIRWITAAAFVFFAPGYSLAELAATQLQNGIDKLERICLALGLNVIVVAIMTSILSMFWVISECSVLLTLSGFSLFFSMLAVRFRLHLRFSYSNLKPKLPILVMLVACFAFVLHSFFLSTATGFVYEFGTNSSLIDLSLLVFAIAGFLSYLKSKRKISRFLSIAVLIVTLLLAAKARMYPSLISFGLGNRIGIDSWDSLGHLLDILNNGRYSFTEPFLLFYNNGQISAVQNAFPPGYFSLMASTSELLAVDPIPLTKAVFLFGVLQALFIYALAKRLSGDDVKALLAALLISGGFTASENVKFTSGFYSPIASIGLALVPFGLYLLTFPESRLTRFFAILTAIGLLYVHIASAIIYAFVIFVAWVKPWKRISFSWKRKERSKGSHKRPVLLALIILVAAAVPIADFWLRTSLDPSAESSIHYSEKFMFVFPFSEGLLLVPPLWENGIFFALLIYGIASYLLFGSSSKENRVLLPWSLSLLSLYLFLLAVNPRLSYRIFAYLYQPACMLGGFALVKDFVDKRISARALADRRVALKSFVLTGLFFSIILFAALSPVFIRTSSPDEMYLQPVDEQKLYFDFADWAHKNLPSNGVIVVNNYTSISDSANLLRDMGITMLVSRANLRMTDYEQISATYANVYALDAPNLRAGIDLEQAKEIYSGRNGLFWVKLYDIRSAH